MKEEGGQSLFGFFVGTLLDGKWLLTVTSISYFLELLFIHISRRGIKDLVQVQLSCYQSLVFKNLLLKIFVGILYLYIGL